MVGIEILYISCIEKLENIKMGSKRLSLARVEALIENLKRDLQLTNDTSITCANVTTTTSVTTTDLYQSGIKQTTTFEPVTAAGNSQGTAENILAASEVVVVTGADNTKGVKLPVISTTVGNGLTLKIHNYGGSTLEVYPGTGDRIYPAGDNDPITVAAYGFLEVMIVDTTGWIGTEGVIGA